MKKKIKKVKPWTPGIKVTPQNEKIWMKGWEHGWNAAMEEAARQCLYYYGPNISGPYCKAGKELGDVLKQKIRKVK